MQSTPELQTQWNTLRVEKGRLRRWLALQWRQGAQGWSQFSQNRLAVLGVLLLVIYALMSIAHPILMATIWPKGMYDPQVGFDLNIFPHPAPPSPTHLLGTDTLGRDVLSRLLAATTPTFLLALTAALTTAAVSTLGAALAVYWGGLFESLQLHLADVFLLVPAPLIMVVIGGTIDIHPIVFGLVYGLVAGLGGASIVMRSQALSIIHKPYIEAARVAGAGGWHVALRHLIPNMLPLAAVQMLVSVTGAVFADGFSTFLGLSRTRLNWGSMIYDSFTYQVVNSAITWNVLIPSALAISLFAAAFYMIARGLHEVAEPRLRPVPKAKPAPIATPPKIPAAQHLPPKYPILLDDSHAFAWLESLAARQGATQGLLLRAEERSSEPPSWVRTTGISLPESSALSQARHALLQGEIAPAITQYGPMLQSPELLPEIIRDLGLAVERNPGQAALWQILGDAAMRNGNTILALEAYRQAVKTLK